MSGSFVRLLMVISVCICVSIFLVTSCKLKEASLKTPEERKMEMLQDSYITCVRQTGKANMKGCQEHVESLKTPHTAPTPASSTSINTP